MIVTYTPAGGEEQTWTYRAAEMSSADAEDIEEAAGTLFDEWQVNLLKGGMKARRALLWVLLRRDTPGLRFKDVAFQVKEVELAFEPDEKAEVRAEIEKSTELTDAEKEQVLASFDDGDEDAGAPKASTGAPSDPAG